MDVQAALLRIFQQHAEWAIAISLLLSVVVAIAGVLPSVFITAANIFFFGFWQGTILSIAGEALGAAISFLLYRYWFRTRMQTSLKRFPKAALLVQSRGKEAAILVIAMRLLPMVPSGIITFAVAIGKMGIYLFILASTIGKIPALFLEAAIVSGFIAAGWKMQLLMLIVGIAVLLWMFMKKQYKSD